MLARALLIVAVLATTAHAKDSWTVIPPAGATETTATTRPLVEANLRKALPSGTDLDIGVWEGDDAHLTVFHMRFPTGEDNATLLRGIETGILQGLRKRDQEQSFVTRTGQKTRDSLQTGTLEGQPMRLRMISGVGNDARARMLQGACVGAVAACTAALDSLAIDERALADLTTMEPAKDESSAYRLGQILGYVTMLALVSWGISTAVRKRRRVRPLDPS